MSPVFFFHPSPFNNLWAAFFFLFSAVSSERCCTKRRPFKRPPETGSFMSARCFVKLTHTTCHGAIVTEIYSSAVASWDYKSFSPPGAMFSRRKPRDGFRLLWRWHCGHEHSQAPVIFFWNWRMQLLKRYYDFKKLQSSKLLTFSYFSTSDLIFEEWTVRLWISKLSFLVVIVTVSQGDSFPWTCVKPSALWTSLNRHKLLLYL